MRSGTCSGGIPLRYLAAVSRGFTGGAVETLSHFIESELHFRRVERAEVLGLPGDEAVTSRARDANELGLRVLDGARRELQQVREDVQALGDADPARVEELLGEFDREVRSQLADTELKVRDVRRLGELVDELTGVVRSAGIGGLLDRVEAGIDELVEARRRDDRGDVDNFAVWKVGGLIILLGVGIAFFIHCGVFGCSIYSRNNYITALIVVTLITLGC